MFGLLCFGVLSWGGVVYCKLIFVDWWFGIVSAG